MKKINTRFAVHYHIPATLNNDKIYFPFYFSKWIDELCVIFKEVILIVHTYNQKPTTDEIPLKSTNIKIINLGPKDDFFLKRVFKFRYYQKIIKKNLNLFDIVCFRYPSPLTIYLNLALGNKPSFPIIVGNMWQLVFYSDIAFLKKIILFIYWYLDHTIFSFLYRSKLVFSIYNAKKVFPFLSKVTFLHTSTINKTDVVNTPKALPKNVYTLITVSRMAKDKGISSLIKAVNEVKNRGIKIRLNVVGGSNDYELSNLKNEVSKLNLKNEVKFFGQIASYKVLSHFDNADIKIVPALVDFSPRTTWEAASRGLPIIMSEGVGMGINKEHFHKNNKMLFFKANNYKNLADQIEKVSSDNVLFKQLQKNSIDIAKERTLENSVKYLVENLIKENYINE